MPDTSLLHAQDDLALLNSFFKGNSDAFTLIYNKYANDLMAYGTGWGVDHETLKDAIQDVFYKLYSNRKSFEKATNLKSYLIRSLKNRILDMRKAAIETTRIESLEFSIQPIVTDALIEEEDRKTIEEQIETYLSLLTGRQREAIYLRYIDGLDYEEIAQILNMTAPAVRKLVCRGIARLRMESLNYLPLYLLLLGLASSLKPS
ncbi:MAG: sigma-70 family RNA polymerase sigma factor [Bacteroides sp.]|jgi:RNA polymerase sigma factor (sigma-70 family)|nr:sigma-70 family RNA polymerase sigma factor [Bacteroides sp.]MCI1681885.1 sigma-70 family RNA polymerase sigma factor [Bacteroides sp.]